VSSAKKSASKVLTPLSGFVPILLVPIVALESTKDYNELSLPQEPIHIKLEPVNSSINTASNEVITILEYYLQIALPIPDNYSEKSSFIKFIPCGWWLRWKGEPNTLTRNVLMSEMKQGKKITFSKGTLRFRGTTYDFIENAYVEQGKNDEIKCFGIFRMSGF
jgi:hypothetical protein